MATLKKKEVVVSTMEEFDKELLPKYKKGMERKRIVSPKEYGIKLAASFLSDLRI